MTPTPCRVAEDIIFISLRIQAPTYLLTQNNQCPLRLAYDLVFWLFSNYSEWSVFLSTAFGGPWNNKRTVSSTLLRHLFTQSPKSICVYVLQMFFLLFPFATKILDNRSRERLNGFSWNFYQTIAGKWSLHRRTQMGARPPINIFFFWGGGG